MDRARTYASKADLVIYVIDASTELDESDYAVSYTHLDVYKRQGKYNAFHLQIGI